eukprot:1160614-Pelagomonas_calceolata.AAC.12
MNRHPGALPSISSHLERQTAATAQLLGCLQEGPLLTASNQPGMQMRQHQSAPIWSTRKLQPLAFLAA